MPSLRLVEIAEHDVARFEVAMHDKRGDASDRQVNWSRARQEAVGRCPLPDGRGSKSDTVTLSFADQGI